MQVSQKSIMSLPVSWAGRRRRPRSSSQELRS